jgi:tetratricopeptide (TPR) repeat protein
MFVSTDARTFKEPPSQWTIGTWTDARSFFEGSPQSLTGDLIREGVTGVAGHVAEPYLEAAIRPQVLFPAYFSGFNLAESFYLAMPYLSWQTIVIGDPLCSPFESQNTKPVQFPVLDSRTQLPSFFSERRIAFLTKGGIPQAASEFLVKGEARLAAGDREGGRAALEAATEIDGRLALVHSTLADIYEAAGEYDKAIARYRAVLKTAPNNIRSLNNLAYALAVRKNAFAEALPIARQAHALAPGISSVTDTLGWVYYLMGNLPEAERLLTQAAKEAPPLAEVQIHLAQLYVTTSRSALAGDALKRALQLEPELRSRKDVADLLRQLNIQ